MENIAFAQFSGGKLGRPPQVSVGNLAIRLVAFPTQQHESDITCTSGHSLTHGTFKASLGGEPHLTKLAQDLSGTEK